MKKAIILLLFLAIAYDMSAQAQRRDTVVLSVYNNNQRFMLYPMPFGKDRPDIDFTAPMRVALDTVHVLQTSTQRDSAGRFPKRWVTSRRCGKLPKDSLTGKVVLIYMNTGCDISTQVYNAQEAGAIVVIAIHTTDNRDSVELPKQGGGVNYVDKGKVKIPCFTVRKGIGERLTAMLPSLVGIQRPRTDVVVQPIVSANPNATDAAQSKRDQAAKADQSDAEALAQSLTQKSIGWDIAPNPVTVEAVINYNFATTSTINIDVFNELGQIVTNYELPNTQTGKVNIDVSAWQNGAYYIRLKSETLKEVKRLMVVH